MSKGTVRVVSTHPASQGPYVILCEADYDPAVHRLYADPPAAEVQPASTPADPTPESPAARRGPRRKS